MPSKKIYREVPPDQLRWRLDPATLPFETTDDLQPLEEIIGQQRGVEAIRFGIGMERPGYNVFVTGMPGTGRMATVKKLMHELSRNDHIPDDLCYVNNFENPEAPILLSLKGGTGNAFRKAVSDFVKSLKKDIPRLFESQEYINTKKEIMAAYESKGKDFFKGLDQKVKEQGFTLVDVQVGQIKRPEVMPMVDGNPMHIDQVEELAAKGRFPKEEFEGLNEKQAKLREEVDKILLELRELQKEVQETMEKMDREMFVETSSHRAEPIIKEYEDKSIKKYMDAMIEDMANNLQIFRPQAQSPIPGMPLPMPDSNAFQPYEVNLIVDNRGTKGSPVIIESHPTYRNLFGSIERIVDRSGVWRTDFSKIKVGSFVQANGGYLVFNLLDAIVEQGVWYALKRALKSKKLEIETYDPFYLFTTTGLKPEPIDLKVKVIVVGDDYLYHMLQAYDQDVKKIFKVRADFDTSMDKNEKSIQQFAEFIKMSTHEEGLLPFDRQAAAALLEKAVRMTGRQEKISTSFPQIADLIREADYFAKKENGKVVQEKHVDQAIEARVYRSNMVEERMQEMIDRGTLMIDVDREVVGQVNGLAVYSLGEYMFGKPSRITASTSMGRAGIINIEREAEMSGNTHNKGVLILSGFLRERYAQDKPLTMSASIAFEQSYSGVDGDSASSTEIYALLSSLAEVPLKQYIAVTGSVNQKGEVQPIGGVNQKIEGFFDCCRKQGLNKKQGVMIPERNVKDLMLRKDVVEAVEKGTFHVYPVETIDEGIEILTGKKAGKRKQDGTYPQGTVNELVDRKLKKLAEDLSSFGDKEDKEENDRGKRKKRGTCDKHKTGVMNKVPPPGPIEAKVAWAEECCRVIKEPISQDRTLSGALKSLNKAVHASHREMVGAGIVTLCRQCDQQEGGSCCGAGIENRYDGWLLLINLLLGIKLPRKKLNSECCFFWGDSGCTLLARHVICVNYMCKQVDDAIPFQKMHLLREKEGEELQLLFFTQEMLKKALRKLPES